MPDSATQKELEELRRENQALRRDLVSKERLLNHQSQLMEAIEALPDGLALYGPDEKLVLCNAKYRELHPVVADTMIPGISIEEVLQAAVDRKQHSEMEGREAEWKAERLAAFRAPGAPIEQAFADGSWRRVYERRTADGSTVAVRIDITEPKKREQELNLVEERLTDYLEASADWSWEMDSDCRFSYFSSAFEEHTGVPPEALLGKTREETGVPSVDPEQWALHLANLAARRSFRDFRHPRTLENGEQVYLSISGKALFDVDGRFLGYRGIGRNITEQVSVEHRATRAEALLESAVDGLSETFALWGPDDRLVLSNRMFRAFNVAIIDHTRPGTALADFYRAGVENGLFPLSAGCEETWLADRLHSMHNPGAPFEVQRQDGRWLLVNDQKMPDGGIVTIGTDITDRKKAEAALRAANDALEDRVEQRTAELNQANTDLRANKALLETVLDNLPDLTGMRGPDGRYLLVNKVFEDWYAMPRDQILGKKVEDIWPRSVTDEFYSRDAEAIEKKVAITRHVDIAFPDGVTRAVRTVRFPVFVDGENLLGVCFINTDVTDLVGAQRDAVEKSTLLQNVLDAIPAHITVRGTEGRFLFANRYLADRLGISSDAVFEKSAMDLFPERGGAVIDKLGQRVRESGEPIVDYEWQVPNPEGRILLVNIVPTFGSDGSLSGTVGIGIDISDRKKLEEQLQQSQKMEAIGQLTGGISHDFNNLLAVIIGNLEILEEELVAAGIDDNEDFRALLGAAMSASEKGAKLNKQLLAFSRRQPLAPKSIDLNEQIEGMVDLLCRTLGETIAVEVVSEAELNPCDADPVQVEAALLNLAINARDAMPDGGTLTIELSNQELREQDVINLDDVDTGPYVMLAVRDTGFGIAPENLEHVFEPFFTTKDVGQGSGLGLSMVFGFAKQSNGHVAIESREGDGTTVRLYLPRADAISPDAEKDRIDIVRSSGETVLLVENDIEMKALTITMLKELGYSVLEAIDGESAVSVLEGGTGIDVLLTDVVLPGGMDGRAIAEEARTRVSGIKVLFMSGYPREVITSKGNIDSGVQLLEKPFRKFLLARKLREVIEN